MTRQYFYLTQLNVSCKNRYKRLINICFPEFEEIFKGSRIYEETALNFIKTFPHAYIVKEKRIDALYNNLLNVVLFLHIVYNILNIFVEHAVRLS